MQYHHILLTTALLALAIPTLRADDSQALQQQLQQNHGTLQLEGKTYTLSKPILCDLKANGRIAISGTGKTRLIMTGPGPAIRLVGTHDGTADPQSVRDDVWEQESGPLISNLEIIGDHPEADGIEAEGTIQLRINNVTVRLARHGIRLLNRNRNVIVSDCHLYENNGIGLYLDNANLHQINVGDCHISYNKQGGIVCRAAQGGIRNLHITGCDIEANFDKQGPPTANVLVDVPANSSGTAEVAITGCTIQHTRDAPDSANIRIHGHAQPIGNLKSPRIGNVTITGNILSDVHTNIHLHGCRGVAITGNTLWMATDYNLLVEESTAIALGPNTFDHNPYYVRSDSFTGGKNAVLFKACQDSTIQGLHLSGTQDTPAGLTLEDCRRINITGCTILDCDGPELLLKHCEHCQVTGCLLSDERENAEERELQVEGGRNLQIQPTE